MKLCGHCSEWKAFKMFPRNRTRRDGLGNWCKACCRIAWTERKLDHSGVHYVRDVVGRLWVQPELPL